MVMMALLVAGAALAQEPMLPLNPGFEMLDPTGWALEWERWPTAPPEAGAVGIDPAVSHSGQRSLRLHHDKPTSYTRGQQAVVVKPNRRYYFRAWIRGEEITPSAEGGSMGARLYIEGIGGRDRATERETGTFGWKEVTLGPLDSGAGGKITIMCYLHQATGTVWFDDVEVIEATPDFEKRLRQQHLRRRFARDLETAAAAAEAADDGAALEQLAALAARIETTDDLPDRVDYRRGPPYFPLHADLFRVLAEVNARRLEGAVPVAAWSQDPFSELPVLGLVPQDAPGRAAALMGTDEREQVAITLCNLTRESVELAVSVEGLEGPGAPGVTLREAVHIEDGTGGLLADPLPRLTLREGRPRMHLPPGVFRQLWLDVSSRGATPGKYRAELVLADERFALSVPFSLEVLPVRLPQELPIATWSYSYQHEPLLRDRWEQARADLLAHHTNAYCWPSGLIPFPSFDEEGKLLPLDWTKFDAALQAHDNARWLLLWPQFEWETNLKLRQELEVGSALWQERFIAWFRALIAGLAERGLGYDRIVWYPADEPTTSTRVGQHVTAAAAMRRADPQALILANPYSACTRALLQQMAPVIDVWCPELTWGTGELLPFFRENSKLFWSYQVLGFAAPAFERYRLSFWRCWREGITGQGFWAYADCGGSNWDRWDEARRDYAVIYDGDAEELIPGKRWEAWREGIEDYSYLWQLGQQEAARDELQERVDELLAAPTPEGLAIVRERVLRALAEAG